jgi:ankyrin repeat protein
VDQGGGDFETALGGASHMGNREIAQYLLQNGAREDIFHAAMSGKKDLVASFVAADNAIANTAGPHKLTLLYHVAISGDTRIADIIKPHINKINSDCNKALHAAVRSGHLDMTEWLVKNGADDVNTKDFKGNTPFQSAEKAGRVELAALLKKYGGQ